MASEFMIPLLLCVAPVVIAEVGALLRVGHSDIKTTMVYAHLDDAFVAAEVKKLAY